ncbi:iron complex outermembrane receptor protein [Paraperlucidibaca baekdonensis]|uniref:Iron complex outermembrane receptor protein n=1 Tax=Paraperlucidibaca baekdonensis TaxID=748120 RepID=A0A3E0H8T3_9GAMM|nr:TonB-dependent receptor [Paraperlucidibaca baekdonensis]REH39890.1 iron complex outermembrane receptor protein [Paraperlucidibaca baekdonensis]
MSSARFPKAPMGLFALSALASSVALANTPEAKPLLEITITASPLGRTADELVQPVSVLSGEELASKKRGGIGETLANEPGISTGDFGAGASRPVIRGQSGPRVDVLANGISAMDVSALSPDHAVTINPLIARQIEVIKGPATLLYGSSSSGGVINVTDTRLATEVTEGFSGALESSYGSNARNALGAADINYGSGNHQFHLDATRSRSEDYAIPGNAAIDGSGSNGRLANSASDLDNGALGYSYIADNGNAFSVSASQYDQRYGLPIEEEKFIVMRQRRYDAQALLRNPTPALESVRIRLSDSRYRHTEFEAPNEVGTRFTNNETQARIEAVHEDIGGLRGVIGAQFGVREFAALGDEAFVPATKSQQAGLFFLEEKRFGRNKIEFGARIEHVVLDPEVGQQRDFTPISASIGNRYDLGENTHLRVTLTHAERAPAIEELYANGPHEATATFEIGSDRLRKEQSQDIEVGIDHHQGRFDLEASVFHKQARNYIYAREQDDGNGNALLVGDDGLPGDELLLINFVQDRARFTGYELAASYALLNETDGPVQLSVRGFTDAVRGTLETDSGDAPAPRLTPSRYGMSLHGHYREASANISFVQAMDQNRPGRLDTETNGYGLLNADLSVVVHRHGASEASVFVQGTNLLDDDIRRATSFIKDAVPAPGRGGVVGVRYTF